MGTRRHGDKFTCRWADAVRVLALAIVAAGVAGPGARGDDGYARQPGIDVLHYAFGLNLRDDSERIEGRAEVEVQFGADGLDSFTLDLASPDAGRGMAVADVNAGGSPVAFRHEGDRLRLGPLAASRKGERRRYVIRYGGIPRDGLRIGANRDGAWTAFSLSWPDKARQWLPVVDHPHDKATSEFVVDAPSRYRVIANGLLQSEAELEGGRRRTHWKNARPIAVWLNALAVGEFAELDGGGAGGVPVRAWVYPRDAAMAAAAVVEPARQSVAFFADLIGPYPYEKLGLVQAAGMGGGMELAGAIFLGENDLAAGPDGLVAHEIAHQWFGDAVTESDWGDIWLSEGFATYFALLFAEAHQGREALVRGLASGREIVRGVEAATPGLSILHAGHKSDRNNPSPLVYQKGAWVLHMLRGRVGEDAFRAGIRAYYRRFRDGNVSTDDFRREMEQASGKKLNGFFRQWLTRGGFPHIAGEWSYDPAAKVVNVTLDQLQEGEPYDLPLDLLVDAGEPRSRSVARLDLAERHRAFQVPADREPIRVELDPDSWILMDRRFQKR